MINIEESLKLETLNIKEDDVVICYIDIKKIKCDQIEAIYKYLLEKLDNKIVLLPSDCELDVQNKDLLISHLESLTK